MTIEKPCKAIIEERTPHKILSEDSALHSSNFVSNGKFGLNKVESDRPTVNSELFHRGKGQIKWLILGASFLINLLAYGATFSFGIFFKEFQTEFNTSNAATVWIGSLLMAIPSLTGPLAPKLVIHFGFRNVTILGCFLTALGYALSSLSNSIYILMVTLGLLSGFGLSLCFFVAVACLAYRFDTRISLANGFSQCGGGIGTFFYPPISQHLIDWVGWKKSTLILAGSFLPFCICGFVMKSPVIVRKNEKNKSNGNSPFILIGADELSMLAKNKRFLLFLFSNFFLYCSFAVPYTYLQSAAVNHGFSEVSSSYLISSIGLFNGLGNLVLGYLGDEKWTNSLVLYELCMLLCGGATALMPFLLKWESYWLLMVTSGIFGFTIAGNYALAPPIVIKVIGMEGFPNGFGVLFLIQGIATLIGLPISGWVSDMTGSTNCSFILAGAAIFASGILLLPSHFMKKTCGKMHNPLDEGCISAKVGNNYAISTLST